MKTKYTVALSILAGMAVGAVVMQSLHAQAKPAYMIAINEVTNADRCAKGVTRGLLAAANVWLWPVTTIRDAATLRSQSDAKRT